jgi:hypothetical protein
VDPGIAPSLSSGIPASERSSPIPLGEINPLMVTNILSARWHTFNVNHLERAFPITPDHIGITGTKNSPIAYGKRLGTLGHCLLLSVTGYLDYIKKYPQCQYFDGLSIYPESIEGSRVFRKIFTYQKTASIRSDFW